MLQLLPMITGLLQNQQKQAEQKKQDEMAAYMGQAPQSHGESGNGGLLSGLGGMLQGLGGDKKKPAAGPVPGPNGGKIDTENPYGSYDQTPPMPDDEDGYL